jgi:hypothetical protein
LPKVLRQIDEGAIEAVYESDFILGFFRRNVHEIRRWKYPEKAACKQSLAHHQRSLWQDNSYFLVFLV